MLGFVTAAVILNPTDMAIASILDRNIALTSHQHASASVIQEKVVQAGQCRRVTMCSSTQWRALAKLSKCLGPIGRKGGRCQHSSCRASAFPRAPTWRPGLEPWGRLPADPVWI